MISVTRTESYQTQGGLVELRVAIGNGQLGSSTVYLAGKSIAPIQEGKYLLGTGLSGKTAIVHATVTDINPQTNKTVVTYTVIEDDVVKKEFSNQATVNQNGEMAYYLCTIAFA